MEPYGGDTNVIAKVGTTPEDRGLETEDFKAKFDEGLTAFVQWFNTVHKTEFEAHLAEKATQEKMGHVKLPENWKAPALLNGWANFGGGYATCGYMKDDFGYVHIKGLITSTTAGVAFSLPSGYRPAERLQIYSGGVSIDIRDTNGEVNIMGTGTIGLSILYKAA